MNQFLTELEFILFAAITAGTPLLIATIGEIITERAGNMNLGVEGMMLMGAVAGFQAGYSTHSALLAILFSLLAGAAGSLIFAILTVSLRANQVVSGLVLTIFGTGVAGFAGQNLSGLAIPDSVKKIFVPVKIPLLGDIPTIGKIFFNHDIIVYIGYLIAICASVYLFHTRKGLNLRSIGENPASADSAGLNVSLYKYIHILIGGALCGLAGAYLSVVHVGTWQNSIVNGRGWIAVALVIFVSWKPGRAMIGSYFFGALEMLGIYMQKYDVKISIYFLNMVPYVATIFVLVVISMKKYKENSPP
ncbi:MAG TPA: ABC transporter permease, partial [Clostridia bacterium]|nr:ABC transporter permease [Clostridia bacterium]